VDLYTQLYTMFKNQPAEPAPMEESKSIEVLPNKQAVLYKLKQSKNWYVRIKYNDQKGYWRGSTGKSDVKAAMIAAIQLETNINNDNEDVKKIFRVKRITVKEVAQKFIKDSTNLKRNDISIINKYITPIIGDIAFGKLKIKDLKEYIKKAEIKTESTYMNHTSVINKLLRYGFEEEHIDSIENLKLKKSDYSDNFTKEVKDDISPEEWNIIINNMNKWANEARTARARKGKAKLSSICHIILFSGIRPGNELFEIKLKHITPEKHKNHKVFSVKIESGKVSKKHQRKIPLDKRASGVISQALSLYRKEYLPFLEINNETGQFDAREIINTSPEQKLFYIEDFRPDYSKYFGDYITELKEKGLIKEERNISLYSLRHTYITNELSRKRDIYSLAAYTGTSVKMIEDHYSKYESMIEAEEIYEAEYNSHY